MLTDYTDPCAETPAPLNTIAQAMQRAAEMRASWAARPRPITSAAVLTPLGDATVALIRARRQLLSLSAAERIEITPEMHALLDAFLTGHTA
jgi:hypothetical protein